MSSLTMLKRGSIVHLQNAQMADFNNSNVGNGKVAWVVKTHYAAPTRDYRYDESLRTSPPPYSPQASNKVYWDSVVKAK